MPSPNALAYLNGQRIVQIYKGTEMVRKLNQYYYKIEDEESPLSAYDTEVLADNPLVYLKLDDADGAVAADSSGNGNDFAYIGGCTASVDGPFPGGSVRIVGVISDTRIEAPSSDIGGFEGAAQEWTVEAWVKLDTGSSYLGLGNKGGDFSVGDGWEATIADPLPPEFQYYIASGDYADEAYSGAGIGTSPLDWTQLAITFQTGADPVFYADGSVVAHDGIPVGDVPVLLANLNKLCIGPATANEAAGYMQRWSLYGTALSAGRIAAHYAAGPA